MLGVMQLPGPGLIEGRAQVPSGLGLQAFPVMVLDQHQDPVAAAEHRWPQGMYLPQRPRQARQVALAFRQYR
ncbi:hypothetical protein PPC_2487 [Pseudomonas protegens Cab57]|nr:hypothetical protein PPC_2487 [Pseudomonas protegens Cab57]